MSFRCLSMSCKLTLTSRRAHFRRDEQRARTIDVWNFPQALLSTCRKRPCSLVSCLSALMKLKTGGYSVLLRRDLDNKLVALPQILPLTVSLERQLAETGACL